MVFEVFPLRSSPLQQIKYELQDSQQKVSSLQELSAQLLVSANASGLRSPEQTWAQSSQCLEAREKVHVIWNRLKLLLREVGSDLEGLELRLEALDRSQQVRWTHADCSLFTL